MCCTPLAENTGRKRSPSAQHRTTLSGYIFVTKAHNMVNFGPLTAEIGSGVVGHPSEFQRVSHLGSVTARHSSSGRQPNFAALNRGRHLYSTGRPSRWALAHILVTATFIIIIVVVTLIVILLLLIIIMNYLFILFFPQSKYTVFQKVTPK